MNKALISDRDWMDNTKYLRQAYYNLLVKLQSENKFAALAPSCNGLEEITEKRKAEWVKFYVAAINAGVAIADLPDVTSCESLDLSKII